MIIDPTQPCYHYHKPSIFPSNMRLNRCDTKFMFENTVTRGTGAWKQTDNHIYMYSLTSIYTSLERSIEIH
jgi:hypothetical protein